MDYTFFNTILDDRQIRFNELMSRHTTFGIGGPADCFLIPHNAKELGLVMNEIKQRNLPFFVLGGGANLLVRDKGIRGVVISTSGLRELERDGSTLVAGAGVPTVRVAKTAQRAGLSGLEFASGIPGSLGGAAFMNAGAYGGEMSQVIRQVEACDENGNIHSYTGEDLEYAYRHSRFMESEEIIVRITMDLKPENAEDIQARMDEFNSRRRAKQPLADRSAGSTFKRPPGHFVGHMIETLGLKGFSVGDAAVSMKHAGFLINKGHATCEDVLGLIHEVQKRVKAEYDVDIEPEVRIVGEE